MWWTNHWFYFFLAATSFCSGQIVALATLTWEMAIILTALSLILAGMGFGVLLFKFGV